MGAEFQQAIRCHNLIGRGIIVIDMLAANMSKTVELRADANRGNNCIVIRYETVGAEHASGAIIQLMHNHLKFARTVGRRIRAGDHTELIDLAFSNELSGFFSLFRR